MSGLGSAGRSHAERCDGNTDDYLILHLYRMERERATVPRHDRKIYKDFLEKKYFSSSRASPITLAVKLLLFISRRQNRERKTVFIFREQDKTLLNDVSAYMNGNPTVVYTAIRLLIGWNNVTRSYA